MNIILLDNILHDWTDGEIELIDNVFKVYKGDGYYLIDNSKNTFNIIEAELPIDIEEIGPKYDDNYIYMISYTKFIWDNGNWIKDIQSFNPN